MNATADNRLSLSLYSRRHNAQKLINHITLWLLTQVPFGELRGRFLKRENASGPAIETFAYMKAEEQGLCVNSGP